MTRARAVNIPEAHSGYWFIQKRIIEEPTPSTRHGQDVMCPAGIYTYLWHITDEGLKSGVPGEIVMEDTPFEIETHLNFMLRAQGNVLITGLGLGCVARGLLCNPYVSHITCIEKSEDVLKLVQPYMPRERLTIIHADALEWTKQNTEIFDYAWHDLWTNREKGEPCLANWHIRLLINCKKNVCFQGAWAFPRPMKRVLERMKLSLL